MPPASRLSAFVGREDHLTKLSEAFAECVTGVTNTVLVSGEAGIGKSRLIEEFVSSRESDVVVARGQCIDLGSDAPPYAPISGALRALAAAVGLDVLRSAAATGAESLALLVPDLGEPLEQRGGSADRLFESVAVTLETVSRDRTLIVIIEDLHWADPATVDLLRFLVRMVERAKILFVFSFRTDELRRQHPLHAWIPELNRGKAIVQLHLQALSRRQVRELAASIRGSVPQPRNLDVLFERSGGVPFLVEELVDFDQYEDADCFPSSLRSVLLAKYETLDDATQEIVRLLSAGGTRVHHELLASVYSGDSSDIDRAARAAVEASVLVVDETTYAFRHALVRDAIHEELLPGERVRFHTRYAMALQDGHGGGLVGTGISYHWMAAHNVRAAFSASLAAMREATGAFAYNASARMGERALELWDQVDDAGQLGQITRVELLSTTAHALRNAGESDRAIAFVDEALGDVEGHSPELLAGLLRDKASYYANVSRLGSMELLREALVVLQAEPASVLRAIILGELAARLMIAGRLAEAVTVADGGFTEAEKVGSRSRMSVASNIRGTSLLWMGEIERGLADLGLGGSLADGNDSARLRYSVNMSDAMLRLGRFTEAIAIAQAGAAHATRRGVDRTSGAILMSNTIEPMFAIGEWTHANELLDRALDLDPPLGFGAPLHRLKLWSVLWGGDPAEAARLLKNWRERLALQSQIEPQFRLSLAGTAAEIALENGDVVGAWAEVSGAIDWFVNSQEPGGLPSVDLPLLAVSARVLAAIVSGTKSLTDEIRVDDPSFDATDAEAQLRGLAAVGDDWPTAPAFLAIFEAELGGGDVALWQRAADLSGTATTVAYLLPYCSIRLAEALAEQVQRTEAAQHAERAQVGAESMGAGLISARATAFLRRIGSSGGVPARSTSTTDLTDRERQVLQLVAKGLSNRQIAEHLFISPKTASVHVSNILRKLGAATRTEAALSARREINP